jgi:hypothetical protein
MRVALIFLCGSDCKFLNRHSVTFYNELMRYDHIRHLILPIAGISNTIRFGYVFNSVTA